MLQKNKNTGYCLEIRSSAPKTNKDRALLRRQVSGGKAVKLGELSTTKACRGSDSRTVGSALDDPAYCEHRLSRQSPVIALELALCASSDSVVCSEELLSTEI